MARKSPPEHSEDKKRFKCTHVGCSAAFNKNSRLIVHLRKHTGERPFKCSEENCDKTYTNQAHLRRHKSTSHDQKGSHQIICGVEGCGIVLANKYSLKKHNTLKHTNNGLFICHDCGQGYNRKKQLQIHIFSNHMGAAPFKCDKCEFNFTSNNDLNKHKREHKLYTCSCGAEFHRWSLLLAHKKQCQKPSFTCDDCGKKFSHHGNFNDHKLRHLDKEERDVFPCPIEGCSKFYFHRKNLNFHLCQNHGKNKVDITYPCTHPGCRMILKTKQCLKRHLQRHFKWKKTTAKKPRKDKGQKRNRMASVMTGIEPERDDITDQMLLQQCDKTLDEIQKKLASVI